MDAASCKQTAGIKVFSIPKNESVLAGILNLCYLLGT